MSYHIRATLGKPPQAHGVASEADYLAHARSFLLRHGMPPALVRESADRPHAYVSGGWWLVRCTTPGCFNAPSAHPGEGSDAWPRPVAVCLECGAVYRPVFPKDAAEAEAALLERPDPGTRHYYPHAEQAAWVGEGRGQTAAYLRRENKARSLGGDR